MAENRLDTVAVSVDGRQLEAAMYDRLTLVRVEESTQLPDTFELRFDDPHFELFDKKTFTMGAAVEIAFRSEGDLMVVTSAEVTTVLVEQGPTGRHELVLTGFDKSHRLHRGPRSRSFVQMTDADIAAQIASEHGLEEDIESTNEVHEHIIQSNQTDMAFLQKRASQIGFDVWVAGETLHFTREPRHNGSVPALTWGENLHRFRVRFSSAERCDQVIVRAWNASEKKEIVGRAAEGDRGTTASAAEEIFAEARQTFGTLQRVAGHFPVASQAEADALATSLMLRASGGEVIVKGEAAGDPRLTAGANVEINQVGSRLSGKYRVTSVTHIYAASSPYVTRFVCGGKEPASLVDLMGSASGEGWGSLVRAIVTDNDDPDRLGRVKVKFVDLEETESGWAWVVAPGAGEGRGLQLLPEVGDHVLVGFEHDDKRRPIVIGGMWNRSDAPVDSEAVDQGQVQRRMWRSRNGHQILMADESPGSVTVSLGDADCRLHLEQSESQLAVAQKLIIEGIDIEIKAGSKLVLSAPNVEINGDGMVKITGGVIQLN